ncbi:MAG: magnesium chelatase subunit D family protein [Deltaproteobacteria bacterium]|jgi:magnesium chelatase subunit D|nr:magnesium chelatase subunit D family protein [Deltaproteobacteria bacterium]
MSEPNSLNTSLKRQIFPLAALVGQAELKKALLLAAVNPLCGGVLIRGEKGTAKSTAARGLTEILPPITAAVGCPYGCEPDKPQTWCPYCLARGDKNVWQEKPRPFLTLPLNATEDRVAGGLDFEVALGQGTRRNNPGLLAQAHRGLLYIDEVNLLDDHIVDIILDAAASGFNTLEREGLSVSHPAQFLLIGTMNPEEGELRPQFLDRFGMSVQVIGEKEPELRVELIVLREQFEADPEGFRARYLEQTETLKEKVIKAQHFLPMIEIPERVRKFMAQIAAEHHVAGHRADLFLEQAASALCALNGRRILSEAEVLEVAPLVLAHRQRESAPPPPPPPPPPTEPPEQPEPEDSDEKPQEEKPDEDRPENKEPPEPEQPEPGDQPEDPPDRPELPPLDPEGLMEQIFEIGQTFKVRRIDTAKDRLRRRGSGRRSRSRVSQKQGRYVKSGPDDGLGDIALDATIRAAAPYQKSRTCPPGLALALEPSDIRSAIREKKMGHHLFFTVDASGSMGARGRMAAAKGAIMSLLLDAYQKRDQVSLVSFRRNEAVINLPLTTSVDLAGKLLAEMPVGGRTPLSQGLAVTFREVKNVLVKNPLARPIVILITDGRGNVCLDGRPDQNPLKEAWTLASLMAKEHRVKYLVVDTEEASLVAFNLAARLADALGANYFKIGELKAQTLLDIVKQEF